MYTCPLGIPAVKTGFQATSLLRLEKHRVDLVAVFLSSVVLARDVLKAVGELFYLKVAIVCCIRVETLH